MRLSLSRCKVSFSAEAIAKEARTAASSLRVDVSSLRVVSNSVLKRSPSKKTDSRKLNHSVGLWVTACIKRAASRLRKVVGIELSLDIAVSGVISALGVQIGST